MCRSNAFVTFLLCGRDTNDFDITTTSPFTKSFLQVEDKSKKGKKNKKKKFTKADIGAPSDFK